MGSGEIASELEHSNYANDCIDPQVMKITEVDIGEWSDEHPLNQIDYLN